MSLFLFFKVLIFGNYDSTNVKCKEKKKERKKQHENGWEHI